jgi:release factor glutamine methyltransferase
MRAAQVTASAKWTIESVLRWAADDFRSRGIDTPRLDAELLLAYALSTTRIRLIIEGKRELDPGELAGFRDLVKRRRAREPVAYIVGQREFYGRTFRVDSRVLIPRPDTESLVEVALDRTRHLSLSMRALDLCTGSGCVAITLARERPTAQVMGADVSAPALGVARDNALRMGAYNVAFILSDLFADIAQDLRFDVITANPPYVRASDVARLEPEIRDYEPRTALEGGEDGMVFMRQIVPQAVDHLDEGGVLAVEVGAGQAGAVSELFAEAGFLDVRTRSDYGGVPRVVSGVLRP